MFRKDINLQVDARTNPAGRQRGMRVGLRNDRKANYVAVDLGHSEADAVHSYRSLADDVAREFGGHTEPQPPIVIPQRVKRNDRGGAIDMTKDEVAVQAPIET